MHENDANMPHWAICPECRGQGKTTRVASAKRPAGIEDVCETCKGSGLVRSKHAVLPDFKKYPTVAIIGGGLGGTALAVACLHRGIPFTLYERDAAFDARSQGYGLTLQQASKAAKGLGIFLWDEGTASSRHVVHAPDGTVIGEWGFRKWKKPLGENSAKRKNVHIARQTLRSMLLKELGESDLVKWDHKLISFSSSEKGHELTFQVGDRLETAHADLVVGADGIHSVVRKLATGEGKESLRYLDCIVMLGICSLESLPDRSSPLLDSSTVFQTVNGHERMYMMPYDAESIMWQFSFPMNESDAKELSNKGPKAMKDEALKRLGSWHDPIPQILAATSESRITGYPVYDRALFDPSAFKDKGGVTLIGDAAHPMSPFKAQGANQALLDALSLARKIARECDANPSWRDSGIRKLALNDFEEEMAKRSAPKVEDSAKAARLLHSPAVMREGNDTRGKE